MTMGGLVGTHEHIMNLVIYLGTTIFLQLIGLFLGHSVVTDLFTEIIQPVTVKLILGRHCLALVDFYKPIVE